MTTVGLPDTSTDTARELASCLLAQSPCAYGSRVRFHPLAHTEIEHYVDNYHPYDKAGAYAIQEWIAREEWIVWKAGRRRFFQPSNRLVTVSC